MAFAGVEALVRLRHGSVIKISASEVARGVRLAKTNSRKRDHRPMSICAGKIARVALIRGPFQ